MLLPLRWIPEKGEADVGSSRKIAQMRRVPGGASVCAGDLHSDPEASHWLSIRVGGASWRLGVGVGGFLWGSKRQGPEVCPWGTGEGAGRFLEEK